MTAGFTARIADGRTDLVIDHLRAGGAVEATDAHGTALIRWCAYYGDVAAVRILLDAGAPIASLGDNLDLIGAAFHGHWRLCEFLLAIGADPCRPQADTGETALHAALCAADRPAAELVVAVLLAAGADPTARTRPGIETGAFMRDCRTRGETPLHRAAAYGSSTTIRALIAAGAARDARDANGDTPLTWASWHLRPAVVLAELCHGPHRIHPDAIARSPSDGVRRDGMAVTLLGGPHPPCR